MEYLASPCQDEIFLHGGIYERSKLESEPGKMFLIVREKGLDKERSGKNGRWYNLGVTEFKQGKCGFFFCLESSAGTSVPLHKLELLVSQFP